MSRGFVKESDQEELPIVPPRADLPAGLVNYVTEFGYNESCGT
jgi:transcription elongation factor GreB